MRKVVLRKRDKLRLKRKLKIRGKVFGVDSKPRVTIYKSNRYLYVQAVNDVDGTTLACVDGAVKKVPANKEGAKTLATEFAKVLKNNKIDTVVFDRNGYKYHGAVEVFATTLRENSINF
jgi:large subunit ribosomal protein L18